MKAYYIPDTVWESRYMRVNKINKLSWRLHLAFKKAINLIILHVGKWNFKKEKRSKKVATLDRVDAEEVTFELGWKWFNLLKWWNNGNDKKEAAWGEKPCRQSEYQLQRLCSSGTKFLWSKGGHCSKSIVSEETARAEVGEGGPCKG